jgi:hypothetical protein
MLKTEAAWLGTHLSQIPETELSPMLNVGSSTRHFREVRQPWMEASIFAPLRKRGVVVTHLDMKAGDGIDLSGDLMDARFMEALDARRFRSILCSNVLEHVTDRAALCQQLRELVKPGSYLVVTVPRSFPYHPDPIDTRFRPDLKQLAALFPGMEVVAGEEIDCGGLLGSLTGGWRELVARVGWVFIPFVRWAGWVGNLNRLAWAGRHYRATCVIMREPPR